MTSILDHTPDVPADVKIVWRTIGEDINVLGMAAAKRSYLTGEPTYVIRYAHPDGQKWQRMAYASDLFVTLTPEEVRRLATELESCAQHAEEQTAP